MSNRQNTKRSSAYSQTIRETESPRRMERRVFAQVTADLRKYADEQDTLPNELLADTAPLVRNQQLWRHLMNDVVDEKNPLPKALKAKIISLRLFVDRHTAGVLSGSCSVDALINLNNSVMHGLDGLRPEPASSDADAAPNPAPSANMPAAAPAAIAQGA
ncbi:MAG: flagellar biosynthesis regulator FlaF [Pseudomonadota bacterium]